MISIHNKKSNDADKRKTRLNLRLDDKEFELLKAKAEGFGLPVAKFVRVSLLGLPEPAKRIHELDKCWRDKYGSGGRLWGVCRTWAETAFVSRANGLVADGYAILFLSRAWVVDCWYVIAYKPHLAYYRVGDATGYCVFYRFTIFDGFGYATMARRRYSDWRHAVYYRMDLACYQCC